MYTSLQGGGAVFIVDQCASNFIIIAPLVNFIQSKIQDTVTASRRINTGEKSKFPTIGWQKHAGKHW